MNNFWILLCIGGIFTISSFGQQNHVEESEDGYLRQSSLTANVQVKFQEGLPGAKNDRCLSEVCECKPSEIEELKNKFQTMTDMLRRATSRVLYVDYCTVGMKDGRVSDGEITASSNERNANSPRAGRLDFAGQRNPPKQQGWAAGHRRAGEWIQVDLRIPTYVTGVISQGKGDAEEWLISFKISYANSTSSFQAIQDENGNDIVFSGNMDRNNYAINRFPQPITARYFRLTVILYHIAPSGRFEFITC